MSILSIYQKMNFQLFSIILVYLLSYTTLIGQNEITEIFDTFNEAEKALQDNEKQIFLGSIEVAYTLLTECSTCSEDVKYRAFDKLYRNTNILVDNFYKNSLLGFYEGSKVIFDDLFEYYYKQYQKDGKENDLARAFHIVEQQRGTEIFQYLTGSEDYRQLMRRINRLKDSHDLEKRKQPQNIKKTNELELKISEAKKLQNKIETSTTRKIITLSAFQNKLSPQTLFLQFHPLDTAYYAFVINKNNKNLIKLGSKKKIDYLINSFLKNTSDYGDYHKTIKTGYELYKIFFNQIQTDDINRLVIIGDGLLGKLPFDALIHQPPTIKNGDYSRLDYLVYHFSITYALSASHWINQLDVKIDSKKLSPLVIAPIFTNRMKKLYRQYQSDTTDLLPLPTELKDSPSFTQYMKRYFSAKLLLKENATIDQFIQIAPQYTILHFDTHSYLSEENPFTKSRIFLAKTIKNKELINNGNLTLEQVMSLNNISPHLAVLGSCETGLGKSIYKEGNLSFAYCFNALGTPSTINSLWKIPEMATHEIFQYFYDYLSQGLPRDKALQQAKIKFLEQHANWRHTESNRPYYWAGIVLNGNYQPVPLEKHTSLCCWMWLVLFFLLGTSFYLLQSYLKQKQ